MIKLCCPPQYRSKVVRPNDSAFAAVRGALAAGVNHLMSLSHVPEDLTYYAWCAIKNYVLAMPPDTETSFHEGKIYCSGRDHNPLEMQGNHYCPITFLPKTQRLDQFKQLRYPIAQCFVSGVEPLFHHAIYSTSRLVRQGQHYAEPSAYPKDEIATYVCADLRDKKTTGFHDLTADFSKPERIYMADYEIVIELAPSLPPLAPPNTPDSDVVCWFTGAE